ncbi:hypothetical protein ACFWR9_42320 [Streptomyces sp. NPDC058534]|uniref:phage tail protein n=1 Tax=Streptomyces sp. NPDC058534 TaxID=3346541 RepID=UPI003660439E
MALSIGELVGFIRADDRGMQRGLDDAELRLRGFARDAEGRLRTLDGRFATTGEMAALGLRRATDEGDGLTGALRRIVGMAGGLAGVAMSAGRIAAMFGTAVPVAAALVTTLANVAPASAVAVSGVLALQMATFALKLGMQGVGDALTAALDPSKAAEFEEALGKLSPEARKFALAVRELAPAWKELQQDVQDELFRGLSKNFSGMAKSVLPILRRELINTAGALGDMAAGVSGAAKELADDGTLGKATKSARKGLENLSGVPGVFTKALGQIAAAAGPSFERLTSVAADAAFRIGQKLDGAFESGAMEAAIEEAIDLLGDLWDVGSNVFEIIGNIFGAVPDGGGVVGVLQAITGALAEITGTPEFQEGLEALFETMGKLATTAAPLLAKALELIPPILIALAPPVQELIDKLGEGLMTILEELQSSGLLEQLATSLGEVIVAIAPLLPPLAELIAAILPYLVVWLEKFTYWIKLVGEFIERFAIPAIQIITQLLRGDFSGALQTAKDLAADMVTSAVASFAGLPGKAGSALSGTKDAIGRQIAAAGVTMYKLVTKGVTDSVRSLANLPGRARSAVSSLGSTLAGQAGRAGVQLLQAISSGVNSALLPIARMPGQARAALGNLSGMLYSAGSSLIRGFIRGIASQIGAVKDTLSNLTSRLTDWKGPESLDKRLLVPAGRLLIGGFQRGIDLQTPALRDQLQALTTGLQGDFALAGAPAGAGQGVGGRTTTNHYTYNLTQREMTLRDLEALQRRQDALARVGRPR